MIKKLMIAAKIAATAAISLSAESYATVIYEYSRINTTLGTNISLTFILEDFLDPAVLTEIPSSTWQSCSYVLLGDDLGCASAQIAPATDPGFALFKLFSSGPSFVETPYAVSAFTNFGSSTFITSTLTVSDISDAVPEPKSWTMLILGFGAIGQAMRRRKSIRALPA